ncbi:MAG: hypothetical protein JSS35_00530 [Proteobacteria bacterium]|nr:hypothetical protein [Pseudomonadota bacterium]
MAMSPPAKAPKDPAAAREAKLAQALRANLRRRKAGVATRAENEDAGKRDEDD